MIDSLRLGARVAANDVMEFVNAQLCELGRLDADDIRTFLLDYWIAAGGFDDDGLEEMVDDGEG